MGTSLFLLHVPRTVVVRPLYELEKRGGVYDCVVLCWVTTAVSC